MLGCALQVNAIDACLAAFQYHYPGGLPQSIVDNITHAVSATAAAALQAAVAGANSLEQDAASALLFQHLPVVVNALGIGYA